MAAKQKKSSGRARGSQAVPTGMREHQSKEQRLVGTSTTGEGSVGEDDQREMFNRGIALLQKNEYSAAAECFAMAARGPDAALAQAAKVRLNICEQRLRPLRPVFRSAEDHYSYAVILLNTRNWDEAIKHLEEALKMNPTGAHIHSGLALAYGMKNDFEKAAHHLAIAIQLDATERIRLLNDPDFAPLRSNQVIRQMLHSHDTEEGGEK